MKIAEMTDFSPTSKDSLVPGKEGWNAEVWARDLQRLKVDIREIEISLECAEETFEEFFSVVESEDEE